VASELRPDELAYLADAERCVHCEHLEPFHWSDDESAGCRLDDDCPGFLAQADLDKWQADAARSDLSNPLPSIWTEGVELGERLAVSVERSAGDAGHSSNLAHGHTTLE